MNEVKIKIEDIIAEREFDLEPNKKIKLIIGRPQKISDSDDYLCQFQFEGFRNGNIREAWGVDSTQALIIAFQMASALLLTSEEGKAKKIKWLGSTDRDMFGLPVVSSLYDLIGLKYIDEE